jgi:opacity protein-like surface antigen
VLCHHLLLMNARLKGEVFMKKFILFALTALTLIATPAMAKEGLYLGLYIPFDSFSGDTNLDSGNGLGLRGGFGFGRYFSIEGTLFKSNIDLKGTNQTTDYKGGTIDAKLHFPLSGSHFEPYIMIGVGSYKIENSNAINGNGGQLGFGVDMYVFPELSISAGFTSTSITFDEGTPVNLDATVRTIDVGLTYHFL